MSVNQVIYDPNSTMIQPVLYKDYLIKLLGESRRIIIKSFVTFLAMKKDTLCAAPLKLLAFTSGTTIRTDNQSRSL